MKTSPFTIPDVLLSSAAPGARPMPVIGLGTAADPLDPVAMKLAVIEAIKLGYRHFDTASMYGSEVPLGEVLAEAIRLGLVASREELFITTKLWCSDTHVDRVIPAIQNSIRNLQLDYLDLYLIHWPISCKPGTYAHPVDEEDLMPMDFKAVWAAMEECQRRGLTKSIGVSNFSCKKLETILSFATIPPSVNQVEMNPVWRQKKLREFCLANSIFITAFSPLGASGTNWGTNLVVENEILQEIAKAREKTIAQHSPGLGQVDFVSTQALRTSNIYGASQKYLLLACVVYLPSGLYEQGVTFVVKSFNKERLRENLEIFDWELSEDDHEKISRIPQKKMMLKEEFVSPEGPYKSVEELWDGEI
ncbi:hypothetical protein CDL15_Pgr009759 [Punica granatum]|uniref:NADP-dependent oxidoreductase domain-containing protein n=1 Tax=Punica granatum TaxID=22663 RepID=A0A218WTX9_PUNGR|nr:hypothetical protein CDL15_Pgr009759 [Punica granatum]